MNQTKHKKVIWECLECGNQHTSYSNKRHDIQICECGKSGYDLEEHYARQVGNLKIISVNGMTENEFRKMNKEIKIRKYYLMETKLGPHGSKYTQYRRNNEENWEVLMGIQFVHLGRRSEKQLENLFQNYWVNINEDNKT
tara:strand:- start:7012 stop:7431 length:420 start_codon:yes stop_codon:yes gene_type:complete